MRTFFALLIFIFLTPSAFAADLHFDFRTFKVRTHFSEAAAPLRWNEELLPYERAFVYTGTSYEEMLQQPHRRFAGRYVMVTTGCGTPCQTGVLVDRRTGEVVSQLPVAVSGYDYRHDSALLVVNPTDPEILASRQNFPDQVTYYFVWTTTGWQKLAEEPWATDSLDAAGKAIQAVLRTPKKTPLQKLFDAADGKWDVDQNRVPLPVPRPYN